jgi:hypothetical protein
VKISATSALVLHWAESSVWTSPESQAYLRRLDLSEGDALLTRFGPEDHYMHTQTISGRKYFLRKRALEFLARHANSPRPAQVLIAGAGMAPLSIELAALHPRGFFFDIDRYHMREKQELAGTPAHIRFIACDVTDIPALQQHLTIAGFDPSAPTLAILEGLVYYLPTPSFARLLDFLHGLSCSVAGDFCLTPSTVSAATRGFLTSVFAIIQKEVGLEEIAFYAAEDIQQLLQQAGYATFTVTDMRSIQVERSGAVAPFLLPDSSWVKLFEAQP